MSPFTFEVKNDHIEQREVSIERMIEQKKKIIYSNHEGIIFAIYKEDAFEDKVPNESEGQLNRY